MAEKEKDKTKQVLTCVRCSYMNVHQPRENNGKTKYGIMLLIPKDDAKNIARVQEAIEEVKKRCLNTKFGGNARGLKLTWHDGDAEDKPGTEGHYYLNVSSKDKPVLQDEDGNPLMDETEMYSGCYCHVMIQMYGYSNTTDGKTTRGISADFSVVRKAKDGERLDGRQNRDAEIAEASDMMDAALGN